MSHQKRTFEFPLNNTDYFICLQVNGHRMSKLINFNFWLNYSFEFLLSGPSLSYLVFYYSFYFIFYENLPLSMLTNNMSMLIKFCSSKLLKFLLPKKCLRDCNALIPL